MMPSAPKTIRLLMPSSVGNNDVSTPDQHPCDQREVSPGGEQVVAPVLLDE